MLRFTSLIILSIFIAVTCYASAEPDSIIQQSEQVIIKDLPDGTSIMEVTDKNGGKTITKLKSNNERIIIINSDQTEASQQPTRSSSSEWHIDAGGLNIGWNFAPGHSPSEPIEAGKSWEIGIFHIVRARYVVSRLTSLSIGLGIDWKNYKITTPDYYFAPNNAGGITPLPYPANVEPRNSRIKIFTLSLPLMLKQKMPFKLYGSQQWIALGASLDYSPHGSTLTRWKDESEHKVKIAENKIGHRRWAWELVGILGVSSKVGVYIRYQPLSVLRGQGQPSFKSLSTGLIFCY